MLYISFSLFRKLGLKKGLFVASNQRKLQGVIAPCRGYGGEEYCNLSFPLPGISYTTN